MWGTIIPAAISTIGNVIGGLIGKKGQEETNAANAQQVQAQMAFQERMRSTQYQTAVDDMRKAGLNPALAYQQGGAGTPTGASATMQNSAASLGQGVSAGASSGVTTALAAAQTAANVKLTTAQAEKASAEASLTRSEVGARGLGPGTQTANYYQAAQIAKWKAETLNLNLTEKQFDNLVAQTAAQLNLTTTSAKEAEARTRLFQLNVPEAEAKANFFKGPGKYSPYLNTARDVLDILNDAVNPFAKLKGMKGTDSFESVLTEHGKGWSSTTRQTTRKPR